MLQDKASDVSQGALDAFRASTPQDNHVTTFVPAAGDLGAVDTDQLSNEQLARILGTHVAHGSYTTEDSTGEVGTFSSAQLDLSSLSGGSPAVTVVDGSGGPVSVTTPDLQSCAGPVHVLGGLLVPPEVGTTPEFAAATGMPRSADAPAPGPAGACVPTVEAATQAGGGGLITAVELAVVRARHSSCTHQTAPACTKAM